MSNDKPTGLLGKIAGPKNCTDNDGASQLSQDRSSQMLRKAPTIDSFVGSEKPLLKSTSNLLLLDKQSAKEKEKRLMRQTVSGNVDSLSKGSSQEPNKRLLINPKDSQSSTNRRISPIKPGLTLSSKSPEKLDGQN